jgi:hypothetical protein
MLADTNRTSMTNTYCIYTVLRYSWWWTVDLTETCRVLYQINLRKGASCWLSLWEYMRYHDARSFECQIGGGQLGPESWRQQASLKLSAPMYHFTTWHSIISLRNTCSCQNQWECETLHSLSCSQEPTTELYADPFESIPHPWTNFLKIHFDIVLSFHKQSVPLRFCG